MGGDFGGCSPFEARRVAQAFDLAGISNTAGAPLLRSLQGRESGMHASSGFAHAATTNQIARAASQPTLAKNARMGHPPWEWCNARMGHPPRDLTRIRNRPGGERYEISSNLTDSRHLNEIFFYTLKVFRFCVHDSLKPYAICRKSYGTKLDSRIRFRMSL
jgi:hypothetical protein